MIDAAVAVALFMVLLMVFLILVFALVTMVDQGLDGLIKKKIKKRFGGDE